MMDTIMAFLNHTSSSVNNQQNLKRQCFVGMSSSANLQAWQMRRTRAAVTVLLMKTTAQGSMCQGSMCQAA